MTARIRDDSYFQISGWMLNRLKLKGAALQVYAIIYGFSQDGESAFTGSLQYLVDFTNTSKPTILKALKELVDMAYIVKKESVIGGIRCVSYTADLEVANNLRNGSKETLPPGKETLLGSKETLLGSKETLPPPGKETLPPPGKETLPNNKALDNKAFDNKAIRVNYQRIADMYNEICISLPRVKSLSADRKKAIKARLNTYTEDDFKLLFEKAEASDFLRGKNKRNWTATFDWLIKDANMAKVLDGNYDNSSGRKEPVPSWMSQKVDKTALEDYERMKRILAEMEAVPDDVPDTAGNNPSIAERAEKLRQELGGK